MNKLWFEGKTIEDIDEADIHTLRINLYEDCLCQQEEINKLKAHTERLRNEVVSLAATCDDLTMDITGDSFTEYSDESSKIVKEATAQSLAEHDADFLESYVNKTIEQLGMGDKREYVLLHYNIGLSELIEIANRIRGG